MEVTTNTGSTYSVVAHMPGVFVRFWEEDLTIEKNKYQEKEFKIADAPKVCIGGIYESYEKFISSFYKYKAKVVVDSFTNEKSINWVYVAEPIINVSFIASNSYEGFNDLKLSKNNLNRKDVGMGLAAFKKVINISDYFSKGIGLNFGFSAGISYIEFIYSEDNIKLKKNDTISFLYDNGNISDFKLCNSPYKIGKNSQTRYIKCQLYAEDIKNLTKIR